MALLVRVTHFAVEKLASPLSGALRGVAAESPWFRRGCTKLARAFEVSESTRVQGWFGEEEEIKVPLTEEKAAKLGTEILAEGIVWTFGIGLLLHRYALEEAQSREAAAKDKQREAEQREREQQYRTEQLQAIRSVQNELMAKMDSLESLLREHASRRRSWW